MKVSHMEPLCLREQKSMPWKQVLLFDIAAAAGISQQSCLFFRERQVLCQAGMAAGDAGSHCSSQGSAPCQKLKPGNMPWVMKQ